MALLIDPTTERNTIAPELHGQFIEFLGTCIDDGIWVGEDSAIPHTSGIRQDVLDALIELQPPVLRFPGGCYADTYHWRDGIGPRSSRPTTFNENFGTFELDHHQFGTDEFLHLCELIGAAPWINVNMMSGSVAEMRDWMEYCNREQPTDLARKRAANGHPAPYDVHLWGIGNEPWGGGGTMTSAGYADAYRNFSTAMPRFVTDMLAASAMYPIAAGPDGNKPIERVAWTTDFFRALAEYRVPPLGGYDLHFYNWNLQGEHDTSTAFDRHGWDRLIAGSLELEEVIIEQRELIRQGIAALPAPESDFFTPEPQIDLVLGEWGNWHGDAFLARPALRQQVTMRDAITTALTLDILHRHSDAVSMACNAQLVNVLNSLLLTDGEHTVRTANFDVFMMYKVHRGAAVVPLERIDENDSLHAFASVSDGMTRVNLVNADRDEPREVELRFSVPVALDSIDSLVSTAGPTASRDTDAPDAIVRSTTELAAPASLIHTVLIPPASVNVVHARKA